MPLANLPDAGFLASLEHAPIGVMIVDATGLVCWANSAAATIVGEPDISALRRSLLYIRMSETDAETMGHGLHLHFAIPPASRGAWTCPIGFVATNGTTQPVEVTVAPAPDGLEGRAIIYINSLGRQVAAERRFNQIFENLPLGLIVVDKSQRIVQANGGLGAIFGYAIEEIVGQPLDMLLPDRYRETHSRHFAGYATAPTSRVMGSGRDLTGLHRSGQEIAVEIALTALDNASQPLFLAMVTDISGRKRSESALQQTNAQLEEFTYVASHDLRSPLRGIADLVSWIREDIGEDQLAHDVRHNFDRIALRIHRCEQMIDDLLDYARAGVRNLHMERIDPGELIDEAVSMAMVPDSFAVEVDVVGDALTAPRVPLSASLRNLVANAAKHHGGRAGRIRIAMREEGRFSVFSVEDDGRGLAPGNEERIFKLFHRASPGTEGDGVGLAFTRRMINAHGGMITVQARGDLGGARFEIHWPRILLREFDDE